MFISVFELFTIGIGPSSSHTVGPMKAARSFALKIQKEFGDKVQEVKIELFGSLAATGKGHGTDKAILMGLEGEDPETIIASKITNRVEKIYKSKKLNLLARKNILFQESKHIVYLVDEQKAFHSNAIIFSAYDKDKTKLLDKTYYSIGGGFVVEDSELDSKGNLLDTTQPSVPYPFLSGDKLLSYAVANNCSIADIMLENERIFRSDEQITVGLNKIWQTMQACVQAGCTIEGVLPGGLEVKRRAAKLFQKLSQNEISHKSTMQWISLFALAVNEENANGANVVTAPTNGAAGIIPAVLHYFQKFHRDPTKQDLKDYFLTAAAIGSLYKNNASISGAEMGCQGEVGVACSMAAAGLTALEQGTPNQVENAAEIGMEHNLGLTCDPIMGLVQIPCIERNTMGAIKAVNSSLLALSQSHRGLVSLDKVILTMKETGENMKKEYKETSTGGLATNVIEC